MKYASFGSVSTGTMRAEDLIPAFVSELEYQSKRQPTRFKRLAIRSLIRQANKITDFDTENADFIAESLQSELEQFAPPYCYFGSHEGDGAAYGYWLSSDMQDDFDGPKVDDLGEVEKGYRGEVLQVSDHGNVTLYVADGRGKFRKVWACV